MCRLLLLTGLVGVQYYLAEGAAITSCELQSKCLVITGFDTPIESTEACDTGDCEYKVCITTDYSLAECVKDDTDTVSHWCLQDAGCLLDVPGSADCDCAGDTDWEPDKVEPVADGASQCQTGSPGDSLAFIIKDGGVDCEAKNFNVGVGGLLDITLSTEPDVQCGNFPYWNPADPGDAPVPPAPFPLPQDSCAGGANADYECILYINLPEDCGEDPPGPGGCDSCQEASDYIAANCICLA